MTLHEPIAIPDTYVCKNGLISGDLLRYYQCQNMRRRENPNVPLNRGCTDRGGKSIVCCTCVRSVLRREAEYL